MLCNVLFPFAGHSADFFSFHFAVKMRLFSLFVFSIGMGYNLFVNILLQFFTIILYINIADTLLKVAPEAKHCACCLLNCILN